MLNGLIVVAEYANHPEAEMAKKLLESHGIESIIHADDCGGMAGGQTFIRGVQLLVDRDDVISARSLLEGAREE
jgi:hypothetical protein